MSIMGKRLSDKMRTSAIKNNLNKGCFSYDKKIEMELDEAYYDERNGVKL